jgi:hypothetical protein
MACQWLPLTSHGTTQETPREERHFNEASAIEYQAYLHAGANTKRLAHRNLYTVARRSTATQFTPIPRMINDAIGKFNI